MLTNFVLPLPDGLHNTNMDNILADSLPLLTMLACVPACTLFVRHRQHIDLALYGLGFLLACVYHVCHMDDAGLIASRVLGVSGPVWRSADVYMAQWLLGRLWGHALKAAHPFTTGVASVGFPVLVMQSGLTAGQVTLALCARMLLLTMAVTAVTKVLVEGTSKAQWYPRRRSLAIIGYLGAAFLAFPMPSVLPRYYWLFHSIWHVFLAAGCYEQYAILFGEERTYWKECRLCLSDVGARIAQRLVSISEVSQSLSSLQRDRACAKEGPAATQALQEDLSAERWKSADLDMMQQLSEPALFGAAA